MERRSVSMKLKIIIHEAEEGGYWAEVPSIPGCTTQGDTFEELLSNNSYNSLPIYSFTSGFIKFKSPPVFE